MTAACPNCGHALAKTNRGWWWCSRCERRMRLKDSVGGSALLTSGAARPASLTPTDSAAYTPSDQWRGLYAGRPDEQKLVNEKALATLIEEFNEMREALLECVRLSGADVSGGIPSWPPLPMWAVSEVRDLRSSYDEVIS